MPIMASVDGEKYKVVNPAYYRTEDEKEEIIAKLKDMGYDKFVTRDGKLLERKSTWTY
jgi:hypothetical protein